ncbi:MAG: hypothetical protein ISR99_02430 [Parcubacteria group bacterium]|nr:hypothetical protein [Parcubacteria group bacterium]
MSKCDKYTFGRPETAASNPIDPALLRLDSTLARLQGARDLLIEECNHHFVPRDKHLLLPTGVTDVWSAGIIGPLGISSAAFTLRCTKCRYEKGTSLITNCSVCAGQIAGEAKHDEDISAYFSEARSEHVLWLGSCVNGCIKVAAQFPLVHRIYLP